MKVINAWIVLLCCVIFSCQSFEEDENKPLQISGIYPHLAYYNDEGECGTGAVVPWADRLWVITYGPHLPYGSSDKLYEITPDLVQIVREESIGGTPANRMIHTESNQLFIGPYAIDAERNVRVIPYEEMPGRHTGLARHLSDPEEKIYFGTMEEGFYEVDVNTLEVNMLYEDGNVSRKKGEMAQEAQLLLGAHGKGLYSGQGVMVYSNNGETGQRALREFDVESGALYEYDGQDWTLVRRNQFVEVTGPGGIWGNQNPETDPIWTTGWDHKSLLVGVRDPHSGWSFYRLPKASHSYDGAHGWNTEWPRIRDIGTDQEPDYLMTMHGMFWKFPDSFTARNSAGIRPRSAYLKVIGDYTRWNDRLVFGCDDSAHREFLNKRKAKGGIEGPGQSNSNLWFTDLDAPDQLGPTTAEGGVWLDEKIEAGAVSEPFLFSGWSHRSVWVKNQGEEEVTFSFEVDQDGTGNWTDLMEMIIPPRENKLYVFSDDESGEWIRIQVDKETQATAHFTYNDQEIRATSEDPIFAGLSTVKEENSFGGLLYGLGDDRRALGMLAGEWNENSFEENGYYELDGEMKLVRKSDTATQNFIRDRFAIPEDVVTIDEASVLIVDDRNRRWRLPKGDEVYTHRTNSNSLRICREVATERDLLSVHGTFYELPAENADGYAKIRPIASHDFRIHDYASYRGLLIMTGIQSDIDNDEHIIVSEDGLARVWAGVIDDLWKLGKPTGQGGPWKNAEITGGKPSDPYLIGFYDQRTLELTNHSQEEVEFNLEVEPVGHGPWMTYRTISVGPGQTYKYEFPASFQSRWIRFVADKDCKATAWLEYR